MSVYPSPQVNRLPFPRLDLYVSAQQVTDEDSDVAMSLILSGIRQLQDLTPKGQAAVMKRLVDRGHVKPENLTPAGQAVLQRFYVAPAPAPARLPPETAVSIQAAAPATAVAPAQEKPAGLGAIFGRVGDFLNAQRLKVPAHLAAAEKYRGQEPEWAKQMAQGLVEAPLFAPFAREPVATKEPVTLGERIAEQIGATLGNIASLAVAGQAVGPFVAKLAPGLAARTGMSQVLAHRLLQAAATYAVTSGVGAATRGADIAEIAKQTLLGAGLGAAGTGVAQAVGPAVEKLINRLGALEVGAAGATGAAEAARTLMPLSFLQGAPARLLARGAESAAFVGTFQAGASAARGDPLEEIARNAAAGAGSGFVAGVVMNLPGEVSQAVQRAVAEGRNLRFYYDLLGLRPDASVPEIEAAGRRVAERYKAAFMQGDPASIAALTRLRDAVTLTTNAGKLQRLVASLVRAAPGSIPEPAPTGIGLPAAGVQPETRATPEPTALPVPGPAPLPTVPMPPTALPLPPAAGALPAYSGQGGQMPAGIRVTPIPQGMPALAARPAGKVSPAPTPLALGPSQPVLQGFVAPAAVQRAGGYVEQPLHAVEPTRQFIPGPVIPLGGPAPQAPAPPPAPSAPLPAAQFSPQAPAALVQTAAPRVSIPDKPYVGLQPGTPEWMNVWRSRPDLQNEMLEYQRILQSGTATQAEPRVLARTSPGHGPTALVMTERGTKVGADYAIVEADDLVSSHDVLLRPDPRYPQALQPRDRARAASEAQVIGILHNLVPERLGASIMASEGAPVIGPDMAVESGNARVIALKRAYQQRPDMAQRYRQWLIEHAREFGFSQEVIEKARAPVLVRLRTTDVDRVKFAQEANEAAVAAMSATELAKNDAASLDEGLMALFQPGEDGNLNVASNRDFVRAFVQRIVAPADRGRYFTPEGSISQEGLVRIRNAVFAKAYGETWAIEKLAEDPDNNIKAITNGMVVAAPAWAKMRHSMQAGSRHASLDVTGDLTAAIRKLSELRATGQSLEAYLAQVTFPGMEELTPFAKDILATLTEKPTAKRVSRILQSYVDLVDAAGSPNQLGLVPSEVPRPADLWDAAVQHVEQAEEMGYGRKQSALFEVESGDRFEAPQVFAAQGAARPAAGVAASPTAGSQQKAAGAAQAAPAGSTWAGTPVVRREIIEKLDRAFAPIRVGHFRQRRYALGIFKVKPEAIRLRYAESLTTAAHEVGHYLDKKMGLGGIAGQPNAAFEQELLALGRPKSRRNYTTDQVRAEGIAEFMKLWLNDPAAAKAKAPAYLAAFEAKLDQEPEIAEVLRDVQKDIEAWNKQPAQWRVRGTISTEKPAKTASFQGYLSRINTALFDDLDPILRASKEMAAKAGETDPEKIMAAYNKARLSRGTGGKAYVALEGKFILNGREIGPSLKSILASVDDISDFRDYLVSRHALDVIDQGLNMPLPRADYEEVVRRLGPKYEAAAKKVTEYRRNLTEVLVDAGVVSRETADYLAQKWPHSVPLYRYFQDSPEGYGAPGRRGLANQPSPIKVMKGSTRSIIDPIESLVKDTYSIFRLADRNKAARELVRLAEGLEGTARWVERIDEPGTAPGKENIVSVWENGERRYYQLDPDLYRAMAGLDQPSVSTVGRILSPMARFLRTWSTSTPAFWIGNVPRDQLTAVLFSKYGYNPILHFVRGLFHAVAKDDLYWQWLASGGAQAGALDVDRSAIQERIRNLAAAKDHPRIVDASRDPGKAMRLLRRWVVQAVTHPVVTLRDIGKPLEEATRVGAFELALRKGATLEQAAMESRDVSIDFSRGGYVSKELGGTVAFLNANFQALERSIGNLKNSPKRTILRGLTWITLPTILLYLWNRRNRDYEEVAEWRKDGSFNIQVTDEDGQKYWVSIPVKQTLLGAIFGTIPERILRYMETQDPAALDRLAEDLWDASMPSQYVFTAIAPMIELWANKRFYTGAPVVPESEQNLPASEQYGPFTSEAAKALGKALNISPRKIEVVAEGYGGGTAKLAMQGISAAIRKARGLAGQPVPTQPATSPLTKIPGISRVFVESGQQPASIDRFYREYDAAEKELKAAQARGDARAYAQASARVSKFRGIAGVLSDLRAAREQVYADVMSADEKRAKLDKIDAVMVDVARAALGKPRLPVAK